MNCKKYRIKKFVNRNGVIGYIAQERFLWFFWTSLFNDWHSWEHSSPKIYWNEEEVTTILKDYVRIENERKAAYLAGKNKIKNNKYICIE